MSQGRRNAQRFFWKLMEDTPDVEEVTQHALRIKELALERAEG